MIHPESKAPDSQQFRSTRLESRVGTAALCGFLFPALCLVAIAQYSVDWHTIDGGGGTSAGGAYSVSGTIGQPDAGGKMAQGRYAVTGGFWVQAVQTEGAPMLVITRAGPGQVTISWSSDMSGWVLQESGDLASWVDSASGSSNPVTFPISEARRFYRLRSP